MNSIQPQSQGSDSVRRPEIDLLYLFACGVLWRREGDLAAGRELARALTSTDATTSLVAEALLREAGRPLVPLFRACG